MFEKLKKRIITALGGKVEEARGNYRTIVYEPVDIVMVHVVPEIMDERMLRENIAKEVGRMLMNEGYIEIGTEDDEFVKALGTFDGEIRSIKSTTHILKQTVSFKQPAGRNGARE